MPLNSLPLAGGEEPKSCRLPAMHRSAAISGSSNGDRSAVLMDAPPPHEDPRPFIAVAEWLHQARSQRSGNPCSRPRQGPAAARRFRRLAAARDARRRTRRASGSCTSLRPTSSSISIAIRRWPAFRPHGLDQWLEELKLFTDWYCPAVGSGRRCRGLPAGLARGAGAGCARRLGPVTVLRDYHAENIMLVGGPRRSGAFRPARFPGRACRPPGLRPRLGARGRAARRPAEIERAMIDRYVAATGHGEAFERAYWALAAQRNTRILGVFTRLWKRDNKPHYRRFQPRMWGLLERDLAQPHLAACARLVRRQHCARASPRAVEAGGMSQARRALRLRAEVPADVPRTAMIMAAGLGKRMRPLTATKPKPLIEVGGKALLDHVLEKLRAAGVKKVVVNVHYLADALEAHLATPRPRARGRHLRRARAAAGNRRRAGPGCAADRQRSVPRRSTATICGSTGRPTR